MGVQITAHHYLPCLVPITAILKNCRQTVGLPRGELCCPLRHPGGPRRWDDIFVYRSMIQASFLISLSSEASLGCQSDESHRLLSFTSSHLGICSGKLCHLHHSAVTQCVLLWRVMSLQTGVSCYMMRGSRGLILYNCYVIEVDSVI